MAKISVLLSTYNGENYLKSQLDSLVAQSYKEFEIIVRDDGSSDSTIKLLQSCGIKVLDSTKNFGAKRSFAELLSYALTKSASDYVMFCDQDDVWHADKIEKTYRHMQALEDAYGKNTPLLVHSDASVVDEKLHTMAHSFWKHQHINPNQRSLHHFIVNNNVTGCTMMMNRALATKVQQIPQEAIMHDWWIAMVASAFGKIAFINEPLMLYRQHSANDTGAKQYGLPYFLKKFFAKPSFEKYILQGKAFLALYEKELSKPERKMLEEFSAFGELTKYQKLRVLLKYKIWKNGLMRNLGLILFA